nr:hypothetical protein Itr_chr15CG09050 [Ipomoea trifida]
MLVVLHPASFSSAFPSAAAACWSTPPSPARRNVSKESDENENNTNDKIVALYIVVVFIFHFLMAGRSSGEKKSELGNNREWI